MKPTPITDDYYSFFKQVKDRVLDARTQAARSVNRHLVLLYWEIGHGIVEKQKVSGWGDAVVERLAKDLRSEFPDMAGFSPFNMWRMRQLYLEYSSSDFLAQLVPESLEDNVVEVICAVPWGHHVELLKKVKDPAARLYYLRATAQLGWSRSVLLNQIKGRAYERACEDKKTHNFPLALPEHQAEQAAEMMKSSYNLEFLGIGKAVKERELEDNLISNLQQFIQELGYGFCFIGRQYRIAVGRKEYFIDLLFYHRFLKALVAIDLKIGAFEPEYAGKMDFYLNVLNEKERAEDDNPSIGIILCAEKDDVEVEYSLKSKTNPIGVVEYQLQSKLPAVLRGKLPTPKQLTEALRGSNSKK